MNFVEERVEHLFLVRMWLEPAQAEPVKWRGTVEHLPSGLRFNFISLRDLADFIALRLNMVPGEDETTGQQ